MWFCANELYTALSLAQFNIVIGAMFILVFVCIEKEKDVWAALLIVIGTFVKIYGIVEAMQNIKIYPKISETPWLR